MCVCVNTVTVHLAQQNLMFIVVAASVGGLAVVQQPVVAHHYKQGAYLPTATTAPSAYVCVTAR